MTIKESKSIFGPFRVGVGVGGRVPVGVFEGVAVFVLVGLGVGVLTLFEAPTLADKSITIDAPYVQRMLADIVKNEDLSRYIL